MALTADASCTEGGTRAQRDKGVGLLGQEEHQQRGKHKANNETDAHNLDSTKPADVEPEVEVGGFDMNYPRCSCC